MQDERRATFPKGRIYLLIGAVLLTIAAVGAAVVTRRRPTAIESLSQRTEADPAASGESLESDVGPRVARFCGDCHAPPQPDTFPRDAWYAEVRQGFDFYYDSRRSDLSPPTLQETVAYYRARAPERLKFAPGPRNVPSPVRFEPEAVPLPVTDGCGVSHMAWRPEQGLLYVSDMESGLVGALSFGGDHPSVATIARLRHPAHAEAADLNGSGVFGLVGAELGSRQPSDHSAGKVLWVPGPEARPIELAADLGRVADVRPADFDGDGDIDLVVAEFGWRKTGRILLLRREPGPSEAPTFRQEVIDDRHGTIHVPVADLDRDGSPDFVAIVSQEHEVIDAFLNRGDGTFRRERIFDAKDPSYGSSGIELVDFDADGDIDVLATNGDTLDSKYLKPSHGVRWLENRGSFPFVPHELIAMPGAMRARAGDLDGDGDLDIVACSYLPESLRLSEGATRPPSAGLTWLERTESGEFIRHDFETDAVAKHMTLELGDFDGDGDLDLAVGEFADAARPDPKWLTVWWNRGPAASDTPPTP